MSKVAFLFPGQGSQSLGMLSDLARKSPLVKNTFDEASQLFGENLWALAQQGPADRLNQTEITQPAMLAAGVACWRVWLDAGGFEPAFMAGHSLGEYSALVASGSLEFGDAIHLVCERARKMQAATPPGAGRMAAILGLDDPVLTEICRKAAGSEVVSCANFNAPGQVVIAGDRGAVERACKLAIDAGARRVVPLAVSVPSHCVLMRPAAMEFELVLNEVRFRPGGIPVLQNAAVRSYSTEDGIRAALVEQIYKPVRWTDTIKELESRGVGRYAECGPGKVLTGLNRRIIRQAEAVALEDPDSMHQTLRNWK